jgi:lipopolysaccharide assembly protein A
MRFLRYLFLAVVAIVLVIVALANRAPVEISVLPPELADFLPISNSYSLPLFLVILGAILMGLLIGFIWEYFREHRIRAEAARRKRELNRLEREVRGLREKSGESKDDVLALLE